MIPVLVAVLISIKGKDNPFILGILLFLSFMIKQNVFVYFAIGIFIYKFISRKDNKELFCNLLKIYLTATVGILLFLIYLYFNGNLYNFINYCFLGMGEFGINNLAADFLRGARSLYISIIAIIFSIFIICNKKINKNLDNEIIKNIKCLLSFGIPMLLISYPIFNYFHCTLASIIITIDLLYLIENLLIKNMIINRKKEKIIYILIILLFITYVSTFTVKCITSLKKGDIFWIEDNSNSFYGGAITKEEGKNIQTICDYIKEQEKTGKNVKILSYKANMYMLQLNKNNGIFDLAFLGNLGSSGEIGLIEQIKNLKNTLILIETDSKKMFWQESKEAKEYIISNYEKIDEIEEYSAFYIK